ncbi:hypothetical protein chiPu_0005762 [Chiloscyllium punctatum]|uniref:Uncharacterized protein n=1 Tax=Chiloscyllium punctatum TaxID=137246 RepID=A0A401SAB1_CHIPU|nr:hypothetical protein [Chiloscyllium punctatum]
MSFLKKSLRRFGYYLEGPKGRLETLPIALVTKNCFHLNVKPLAEDPLRPFRVGRTLEGTTEGVSPEARRRRSW